jgi:hypothetical protein
LSCVWEGSLYGSGSCQTHELYKFILKNNHKNTITTHTSTPTHQHTSIPTHQHYSTIHASYQHTNRSNTCPLIYNYIQPHIIHYDALELESASNLTLNKGSGSVATGQVGQQSGQSVSAWTQGGDGHRTHARSKREVNVGSSTRTNLSLVGV